MKRKIRIVGLTGTNGAGKGEAAAFFVKQGFAFFSLSDVIRGELRQRGREPTRDNLIRMGNALRKRFGPDILARRVMKMIAGDAVVDSIRNPQETEYLRKHEGFLLLAIDAPVAIRFDRVRRRGRDESAATLDQFIAKEAEEMTQDTDAQQLKACMDQADHLIINDGSLEEFHLQLEGYL